MLNMKSVVRVDSEMTKGVILVFGLGFSFGRLPRLIFNQRDLVTLSGNWLDGPVTTEGLTLTSMAMPRCGFIPSICSVQVSWFISR